MSRQDPKDEARLLIVDDEPNTRDLPASSLRFIGFKVLIATGGHSTYRRAMGESSDLIVLDIILPDMDGFAVTRHLREAGIQVPTLFLAAHDDMHDKIQRFIVGGDDYVTRSFGLEEVVVRIRAILHRTLEAEEDDDLLRVGDLVVDEDAHEVIKAGVSIDLSSIEFKLLRHFVINERRIMPRMQILDHVWGYGQDDEAIIMESYISHLCHKLVVESASGELIRTKRGVGYILRAGG